MKRILAAITSTVLVAGLSLAVAPAAHAAPTSFRLPSQCGGEVTLSDLKMQASSGYDTYDLKHVDVHPNKGKEYVFTTFCYGGDWGSTNVVVVANSSGKRLASRIVHTPTLDIKSASKKNGIKLDLTDGYTTSSSKVVVYFDSTATFKFNKKSAKFVYKESDRPGWVKKLATFTEKANSGKSSTAIGGSKALKSKFVKNTKAFQGSGQIFLGCDKTSSTKLSCRSMLNQEYPLLTYFDFKLKKSGKTWKLAKVGSLHEEVIG